MRTSGAGTETRMIIAICLVALGVVVLLAGGPSQFMLTCEHALRGVAETVHKAWLSVG